MNDYLRLARLSIRNTLMGVSVPLLFLGVVMGLILIAFAFLFYGLVTVLEEQIHRPGVAYLAVGGGVLVLILGIWSGLAWKRHREVMQLKSRLTESQKELLNAVDLAAWVQKNPWGATGLAVGVGFAASSQTYLADMLLPLGKAIAPIVAEMLVAQQNLAEEK